MWLAALGVLPLLAAPFWAIVLSAALGAGLYAIKDLNVPGYRLLVALGVLLPGSRIGGVQLPFAEMSTLVIALAYSACSCSPAHNLAKQRSAARPWAASFSMPGQLGRTTSPSLRPDDPRPATGAGASSR